MSPRSAQISPKDLPARASEELKDLIREQLRPEGSKFKLDFERSARAHDIALIYESPLCRMKFMFSKLAKPYRDELSILYARLHAPDEEPFMEWQGEQCRCWHNILDPLRFLDGLSPTDAFEQSKIRKELPAVVRAFRESEQGKALLREYPPKSAVVLHSVLWKHYGLRLFELFDLRKPDLWEQYRAFLTEYYGLLGRKPLRGPPYEKVC